MSKYSEMLTQIESLKKQAEKQRKEEVGLVIRTIKRQIADLGLTAEELGLKAASPERAKGNPKVQPKNSARTKGRGLGKKVPPRYRDGAGNTWTGRGKKPLWVRAALAEGKTLEDYLIKNS